ncbi:MAG: NfeD family protein [Actinomycetota bacterium]|nr:NfeD family protein [Actinomycetota bacterium]MDQ5807442.1 NfeD family protein [Actinomycetota bacterium]
MDEWVLWLIAAVVLAVGEVLTMGFFLAPFAVGALAATLVSVLGGGLVASGIAFLAVSSAAFLGLRPIARRHMKLPAQLRTGTAALVGKTGTVVETVSAEAGCVRIDGEVWTARPFDDDDTYEAGERVRVLQIRGATALVSE